MSGGTPQTAPSGLRVLLVEDESLIAMLLEDTLAELGHTVVGPAACLKSGLELAGRDAVDIAILDLNLNGEEAYPIADVLAARGVPFVFSTGYGKQNLRAPYGERPILHKPFKSEDLQRLFAEIFR